MKTRDFIVILYSVEYGREVSTLKYPYNDILNRTFHRVDGPAIEYSHAKLYYIDGTRLNRLEYLKCITEALNLPLALQLTDPRWWVRRLAENAGVRDLLSLKG